MNMRSHQFSLTEQSYADWWEQQVLEICRRSWNRPDLTLEELRTRRLGTAKPSAAKSDVQFDTAREAEQSGITLAKYLRENR